MITCHLRYVIDPYKLAEFEAYGRLWIPLVEKFGGIHHGYFLPSEGANNIALALLEALGEPLLSTTLILPGSEMAEFDPEEIADKLGKQLDLVLNGGYLGEQPTTVVDFSDEDPVVRRRGAGDPTPFE